MDPIIDILPPEILGLVAEHIDVGADMSNLRLTCKMFHDVSLKYFSLRFRYLRFIFTPYSMQALIDVSEHPVFGPRIRSISFGTHILEPTTTFVTKGARKTDPEHALKKRKIPRQRKRANEQIEFIRQGCHIDFLARILTKIHSNNQHMELGLFDDGLSYEDQSDEAYHQMIRTAGFGSKELFSELYLDEWQRLPALTLGAIRLAAKRSDFPLSHLHMGLCCGYPDREHEGHSDGNKELDRQLATLLQPRPGMFKSNINFQMSVGYQLQLGIQSKERRLILGQQKQRRNFKFPFEDIFDGPIGNVLSSTFFQGLYISRCSVWHQDFNGLVSAHSSTLRVLKMEGVGIKHSNSSDVLDFWQQLRAKLRLEELSLSDVRLLDTAKGAKIEIIGEEIMVRGEEEVRAMMDAMIDEIKKKSDATSGEPGYGNVEARISRNRDTTSGRQGVR